MIGFNTTKNNLPSMVMTGAIVFLMVILVVSGSWADEGKSEKWDITFAPYLWATALEGNMTVKGLPASVDASFSDIVSNLNFGFLG